MNTQTITLDVSKRPSVVPVLYLRQGDKSGTTLRVEMYDNGSALPLSGRTVLFRMRAPKDKGYYEKSGGVSGNVATFVIDETYAATYPGITDTAYVDVLEGSSVIASTGSFRVVVLEDATEGVDPNTAYTNGVQEWLDDATEQLTDVSERAEAAIEAIGDISELAVPLMSADTRGGAKLGHGLRIAAGEKLGIKLVDGATGEGGVEADGDYLHALAVEGKSVQDGTPTPENPIEVRTVKGINIIGGYPFINSGINGGTGAFDSNPNPNRLRPTSLAPIEPATTYTLSCASGYQAIAYEYAADGTYLGIMGGAPASFQTMPFTFTTRASAAQFAVLVRKSDNASIAPTDAHMTQLEIGAEAHDYVAYDSLGLKVTGKNKLGASWAQTAEARNGSVYVDGEEIVFLATSSDAFIGNAGASVGSSYNSSYGRKIKCEPNQTFTFHLSNTAFAENYVVFFDSSDKLVTSKSGSAYMRFTKNTGTFETPANASYFTVRIGIKPATAGATYRTTAQLEAGSTATEYAPYVDSMTAIPLNGNVLASLPDGTRDVLRVDDAGHAVLTNNVGIIAGGDADTGGYYSSTNNAKAIVFSSKPYPAARNNLEMMSNQFVFDGAIGGDAVAGRMVAGKFGYYYVPSGATPWYIYFQPNETLTSQAEVSNWLATHKPSFYYPLATPQTIDLGYISMPKLSDGSAIELLATIDPPMGAEWWAVGAGAVHESNSAWYGRVSSELAAISEAIADL